MCLIGTGLSRPDDFSLSGVIPFRTSVPIIAEYGGCGVKLDVVVNGTNSISLFVANNGT